VPDQQVALRARLTRPPEYEGALPSYEDVYSDVPPGYAGTDTPARAHTTLKISEIMALGAVAGDARESVLDIWKPAAMDLGSGVRASEIDWSSVGIKECVSKKKKQEQKKAQQVCFDRATRRRCAECCGG